MWPQDGGKPPGRTASTTGARREPSRPARRRSLITRRLSTYGRQCWRTQRTGGSAVCSRARTLIERWRRSSPRQGRDRDLTGDRVAAKQRLSEAETRLRRLQSAIEAGVDTAAVVDAINEAQALRAAARAELANIPEPNLVTDAEVYAMIDSLGNVGAALSGAKPERAASLYEALDLEIRYDHETAAADVTIRPMKRVDSVRVRGGAAR